MINLVTLFVKIYLHKHLHSLCLLLFDDETSIYRRVSVFDPMRLYYVQWWWCTTNLFGKSSFISNVRVKGWSKQVTLLSLFFFLSFSLFYSFLFVDWRLDMPRSIFEQTLYEMIVMRKNLTNTNLSLDEGKIERKRLIDDYKYWAQKRRNIISFNIHNNIRIDSAK